MSKELVIGSNRHETKVAVLEDDQLVELYFQRANEYSLAGSIHKGRVTRVLPGMQSAVCRFGPRTGHVLVCLRLFRGTRRHRHGFRRETAGANARSRFRAGRFAAGTTHHPNAGADERSRDDRGRDDRGRDDRSRRDRPSNRPPAAAPVSEPESFVAPPALVGGADEYEADEPEDGAAPIAPITLTGEVRAADGLPRPTGDDRNRNNDRGGDRRGRRSRRRRGRGGRGIPDNKYAQPGASEPASAATEPSEVGRQRHRKRRRPLRRICPRRPPT